MEAAAREAYFTLRVNESNVPAVQAQLGDALFNLAQCRMLAPGDGYVVDWTVQEGTMVVAMPFRPTGVFINTSETVIVASFPQNWLMNVEPENEVEMVFDPYPGRLFKGKVDFVIPATGEGEYTNTGNLPSAAKVGSYGVLAVRIRLTADNCPSLPLGAGGTVAMTRSMEACASHLEGCDPDEQMVVVRAPHSRKAVRGMRHIGIPD